MGESEGLENLPVSFSVPSRDLAVSLTPVSLMTLLNQLFKARNALFFKDIINQNPKMGEPYCTSNCTGKFFYVLSGVIDIVKSS